MRIDWVTVSAQVVNFLVLVWLLRHFLYRPVLEAMSRRERGIAGREQRAVTAQQQSLEEAQHYRSQLADLEQRRESLLAAARDDAQREKLALLEAARREVAGARDAWRRQLDEEQQQFLTDLRHRTAEAFTELARRALRDLADADLERQLIRTLLRRAQSLPESSRDALLADGRLIVTTTCVLDGARQAQLTRELRELLDSPVEVSYRQAADLLCGIELSGGGQRLGWALEDYLATLSRQLEQAISGEPPAMQEAAEHAADTAG